ncbi:hypothetical protein ScPMuIL_001960 [Solemya velum]
MNLLESFCFCLIVCLNIGENAARQTVEGCPIYGCNTAGTFSHRANIPRSNVSIVWNSGPFSGVNPNALGCVGNDADLVCQYIGPNSTGLASFNARNGSVRWRDDILHYPPLPLMNIVGDVIGSDGSRLVKYDVDGQLYRPVIEFAPRNIYSMTLTDDGLLLMVSREGVLLTYETNGVPYSFIWLNDTVDAESGTFCPIAPAVINVNRAYIITEFKPANGSSKVIKLRRIYAVDIPKTMVGKMKVAWHLDMANLSIMTSDKTALSRRPIGKRRFRTQLPSTPQLLYSSVSNMLYASVPATNSTTPFVLSLRDKGTTAEMAFKIPVAASGMALYTTDTIHHAKSKPKKPSIHTSTLWLYDSTTITIWGVSPTNGTSLNTIELKKILQVNDLLVSSNISVSSNDAGGHVLFLSVKIEPEAQSGQFKQAFSKSELADSTSFAAAIDGSVSGGVLLWLLPVPLDAEVVGQFISIAGVGHPGASYRKDKTTCTLVAYAHGSEDFIFGIA